MKVSKVPRYGYCAPRLDYRKHGVADCHRNASHFCDATLSEYGVPARGKPCVAVMTIATKAVRHELNLRPSAFEEARQAFAMVVNRGRRTGRINGGTCDLVRSDLGVKKLPELNQIVLDAAVLARAELLEHDISLEADFASALPPPEGDAVQLRRILSNLIHDVIEAMVGDQEGARILTIKTADDARTGLVVTILGGGAGFCASAL